MRGGKRDTHLGQTGKVWCLNVGVSAQRFDPVVKIIDRDHQDVGAVGWR